MQLKTAFFTTLFFSLCLVCLFSFKPSQPSIGIISDSDYCGERELALRIELAAKNLGWKTVLDETRGHQLKKRRDFDWVISIDPYNRNYHKPSHNYVTLLHPFNYKEKRKHPVPFYDRYKGYLLTITPETGFIELLLSKNKPFFSIPFYPTLQSVPYQKVVPESVMTMLSVWGDRRDDEKFKRLYSLLSESGFTKFYGLNNSSGVAKENYLGKIPFDGISVIETLQKHGIALLFHSDIHNREAIPSSRIFEAAAASTVIISDINPFIKKHFGDAVFYVDTSLSAEEIYQQIQTHVETIHHNPEKALEMAKKAHEIFIDQFTMEAQLLNIMAMHEKILVSERKQRQLAFFQTLCSLNVNDLLTRWVDEPIRLKIFKEI